MTEPDWTAFNKAMAEAEAKLSPYDRALVYLRAAANWSDEEMKNPLIAIAARNCAREGLKKLGESL